MRESLVYPMMNTRFNMTIEVVNIDGLAGSCVWVLILVGVPLEELIKELDSYIRWDNEKRIKMRLGGMSPLVYRRSLGLVA